jgi:hypothetical protein
LTNGLIASILHPMEDLRTSLNLIGPVLEQAKTLHHLLKVHFEACETPLGNRPVSPSTQHSSQVRE